MLARSLALGLLLAVLAAFSDPDPLKKRITLHLKEAPIPTVLQAISEQSELSFVYNAAFFPEGHTLTLHVDEAPLQTVLDQVVGQRPLAYRVLQDHLVFYATGEREPERIVNVLGGTVTDRTTGTPLAGAVVVDRSLGLLARTDSLGQFSYELDNPDLRLRLTVSHRYYQPQDLSLTLNRNKAISVSLLRKEGALSAAATTIEPLYQDSSLFSPVENQGIVQSIVGPAPDISLPEELLLKTEPFYFGFVPYLDTSVGRGKSEVHYVALSLLVSYTGGLKGLGASPFLAIHRFNTRGLMAAGLANITGGTSEGLALAGGFNTVGLHHHGVQISGINRTKLDMKGLQLGYVVNYAGGRVIGLQASPVYNQASSTLTGVQLAAVRNEATKGGWALQAATFNRSKDHLAGLQLAAFQNRADRMAGLQLATATNRAESMQGMQASVVSNTAERLAGVQGALLVNVAGRARGLQAGLVINEASRMTGVQASLITNAADTLHGIQMGFSNATGVLNGVQLGLVNFADTVQGGTPLGLVSLVRSGLHQGEVTLSSVGLANLSFRSGIPAIYNVLRLTGGSLFSTDTYFGLGYGLGNQLRLGDELRLTTQAVLHALVQDIDQLGDHQLWGEMTSLLEVRLTEKVFFLVGPSLNYNRVDVGSSMRTLRQAAAGVAPTTGDDPNLREDVWVGLNAGFTF